MNLVFLLEERSAKIFLENILERFLPPEVHYKLIPHDGKQDLRKSIPRKLRAWQEPGAKFIIVQDQDSSNCKDLKHELQQLCVQAGRPDSIIRIACRELEAWYLGDLNAIDSVYGTALKVKQHQRLFRNPDGIGSPSQELKRLIPEFSKTDAARRIGQVIQWDGNRSISFGYLIRCLEELKL